MPRPGTGGVGLGSGPNARSGRSVRMRGWVVRGEKPRHGRRARDSRGSRVAGLPAGPAGPGGAGRGDGAPRVSVRATATLGTSRSSIAPVVTWAWGGVPRLRRWSVREDSDEAMARIVAGALRPASRSRWGGICAQGDIRRGRIEVSTHVASDPVVDELEAPQARDSEGPCLRALTGADTVYVPRPAPGTTLVAAATTTTGARGMFIFPLQRCCCQPMLSDQLRTSHGRRPTGTVPVRGGGAPSTSAGLRPPRPVAPLPGPNPRPGPHPTPHRRRHRRAPRPPDRAQARILIHAAAHLGALALQALPEAFLVVLPGDPERRQGVTDPVRYTSAARGTSVTPSSSATAARPSSAAARSTCPPTVNQGATKRAW